MRRALPAKGVTRQRDPEVGSSLAHPRGPMRQGQRGMGVRQMTSEQGPLKTEEVLCVPMCASSLM